MSGIEIKHIKKPKDGTLLFRVVWTQETGQVEIAALPASRDPGVMGLIIADVMRTHAGLYEQFAICSREEAMVRIAEVLLAELKHPTTKLTEFVRDVRPKGGH
jgi:hypothetical protein